jgi:hypothetical protein
MVDLRNDLIRPNSGKKRKPYNYYTIGRPKKRTVKKILTALLLAAIFLMCVGFGRVEITFAIVQPVQVPAEDQPAEDSSMCPLCTLNG